LKQRPVDHELFGLHDQLHSISELKFVVVLCFVHKDKRYNRVRNRDDVPNDFVFVLVVDDHKNESLLCQIVVSESRREDLQHDFLVRKLSTVEKPILDVLQRLWGSCSSHLHKNLSYEPFPAETNELPTGTPVIAISVKVTQYSL
jgi:hypothetical protein